MDHAITHISAGAEFASAGHGAEKLLKSVPITTDGDEYRWAERLLASSVGGS
jgi:hypothetical protein